MLVPLSSGKEMGSNAEDRTVLRKETKKKSLSGNSGEWLIIYMTGRTTPRGPKVLSVSLGSP